MSDPDKSIRLRPKGKMAIAPQLGRHLMLRGDSNSATYQESFDLVLTSPPFFHPCKRDPKFGFSPKTRDLIGYSNYVAEILLRSTAALKQDGVLCFVKTDVKYNGTLVPVGFRIADACIQMGLTLRAQWIWQRFPQYSPYAPSFANAFLFADAPTDVLRHPGLITNARLRRQKDTSACFAPDAFQVLIESLSPPGGTILDPFAGTGSVVEAAARSGRWSVGIEISTKQIAKAKRYLASRQNVLFANGEIGDDM